MQIFKFGGASIKNVEAIKQLKKIVSHVDDKLVIVVSAMGKTTNKLEKILKLLVHKRDSYKQLIKELRDDHMVVVSGLFEKVQNKTIFLEIEEEFEILGEQCLKIEGMDFDFAYDQIISMGEIISTKIVSAFLQSEGILNQWIDIREVLVTDSNYRDAHIQKDISEKNCEKVFNFKTTNIYVTQGFIAATEMGETTTLGREGSDYTASMLASYLDAQSVTLWKDVKGIYNVDPARSDSPLLVPEISYFEMMELAYYGAKVIHPKALKPIQLKNIPLFVKSFIEPEAKGTMVSSKGKSEKNIPYIIFKEEQVLISISPPDLSFIVEEQISRLFALLNAFKLSVNLMQHAAISFTVCVDSPRGKEVEELIAILSREYKVLYNDHLQLITIKNYTSADVLGIINKKQILLEQRSRQTLQVVVGM